MMLKLLLLVTLPLTVIEAISFTDLVAEEFELFKVEHGKKYENPVEEKFRMKIFMENKHKIANHNKRFENGEVTYKLAMNHYGDMLHHEFVKTMNGFRRPSRSSLRFSGGLFDANAHNNETNAVTYIEPFGVELPKSIDWRKNGAVTPVKNQGQCGSCWAFSATGALEGQHFRKTGQLVSLSEQNLIDCSRKEGNNGCNGGLMDQAFQYIKHNHGIDTEEAYPYNADEEKCRYNPKKSGATDKGYVDIPEGDEKKLMSAVATVGPVSIAIDASHETFQFYSSGVYYDKGCSSTDLDHGVLCVGYGTDSVTGQDYWLVKNSWGEKWGSDGYIKMARNKRNACGVASSASYPLV